MTFQVSVLGLGSKFYSSIHSFNMLVSYVFHAFGGLLSYFVFGVLTCLSFRWISARINSDFRFILTYVVEVQSLNSRLFITNI